MKKRSLISIVSMLSLLLGMLMLVHNTTFADVDYDITNVNVHAHVNKNGSLTITRSIDYDFDSDAHGVYYRQNLAKNQKLINQKSLFLLTMVRLSLSKLEMAKITPTNLLIIMMAIVSKSSTIFPKTMK